jgi:hypothetical protein
MPREDGPEMLATAAVRRRYQTDVRFHAMVRILADVLDEWGWTDADITDATAVARALRAEWSARSPRSRLSSDGDGR